MPVCQLRTVRRVPSNVRLMCEFTDGGILLWYMLIKSMHACRMMPAYHETMPIPSDLTRVPVFCC